MIWWVQGQECYLIQIFLQSTFTLSLHRVRGHYSFGNKLIHARSCVRFITLSEGGVVNHIHILNVRNSRCEQMQGCRNEPCLTSSSRSCVWWCFWCARQALSGLSYSFCKHVGITRSGFGIRYKNPTPKSGLSCSP